MRPSTRNVAFGLLILLSLLFGTGCQPGETESPLKTADATIETMVPVAGDSIAQEPTAPVVEEDMVFQTETAPEPSWIPADAGGGTPWYDDLCIVSSSDGIHFEGDRLFLPHAGVGHLLLTRDHELIATFQYFSYTNRALFDKIAYTVSVDSGQSWSPVRPVDIELPMPGPNPVDPTLVELPDGSLRLYFTFHQHGDEYPQLFSAHSEEIGGRFEWEGKQLATEQLILDPAVVYFQETWHHYTTAHETAGDGLVHNVHSTSEDGLNFTRQEDIPLEMSFLGNALEVDGGLRFYGSHASAFSQDGFAWELEEETRGLGADPGVVLLPDGTYLGIYTGVGKK